MRNKLRSVWIGLACCGLICGADWLTDGGNRERTAWQQDEHILSKDNVKDLKILWKIQLDNQPRDMHSLFAPLIADKVPTSKGPKQIAIEAGVSDNLYAIDVETGTLLWQKHFQYPPIQWDAGCVPAIRFALEDKRRHPSSVPRTLRERGACMPWPQWRIAHVERGRWRGCRATLPFWIS